MSLAVELKGDRTVNVLLIRKDGVVRSVVIDGAEIPLSSCEWKIENGDRSNELTLKFKIKANPAILDMPTEITTRHRSI
jgi:hypothetical protein